MSIILHHEIDNIKYHILESVPLGIFIIDAHFKVHYWNRTIENWSGITQKKIINQSIITIFPQITDVKYRHRIEDLFSGGAPVIFSAQLHHHIIPCKMLDGQYQIQHTVVTAYHDADSNQYLAMFSIQDVTEAQKKIQDFRAMRDKALAETDERKKIVFTLNQALIDVDAANRTKNRFLANISHELRTPLNAIIGYTELINEFAKEQSLNDIEKDASQVLNASHSLLGLINGLLDIVKLEVGTIDYTPEIIDVCILINQLISSVSQTASKNNTKILSQCPENLGEMYIDKAKLFQILYNICNNACKFTENGKVIISVSKKEINTVSTFIFTIRDTGIGISSQDRAKIFQVFGQGDTPIENRYGGTGIGLALCKKICEQMNGRILVNSELGVGSEFVIHLPAICKVI